MYLCLCICVCVFVICVFVYLPVHAVCRVREWGDSYHCICALVYLCIFVFVYLCICQSILSAELESGVTGGRRWMDRPSSADRSSIHSLPPCPPSPPVSLSLSDPRHPSHTLSSPSLSSRTRSRVLMMTLMMTWRMTWRNTYFLALCCCLGSHGGRETGQK